MIYVNARFLTQEMTGVQRFAEMISLQLNKKIDDIIFLCPPGVIRESIAKELNAKQIGWRNGHLWEQLELPLYLAKHGFPLLINLGSTGPVFYTNKIVTHHDITYLKYPESYSKSFLVFYKIIIPLILKTSKHLLTVSHFSKKEITRTYNYPDKKTSVIYNAAGENFKPKCISNPQTYILAVSSHNYHKNHHGMINAFLEVLKKSPKSEGIKIKIIGQTAKSFSKQGSWMGGDTENIEFLGRVSDEELVKLYQNAMAFIFPSFYEGFGIPPLEAQSCGCPVISSNTTSMPEILAESVLYFDPHDIADISRSINKIINDIDLRKELIVKGYRNAKRFSWEKSTNNLIKVIEKLDKK